MSVSELTADWNYSRISDNAPSEDFQSEPPLQFAALFAQSQPSEGKVAISHLGAILNRADISNEQSALILELCSEISDNNAVYVTESNFYWALHQAAAIQSDESYNIQSPGVDQILYNKELKLSEETRNDDNEIDEQVLQYNPTASPLISVVVQTKDAGSFMLKHAVYTVQGKFKGKTFKNLRRYRDFDNLANYLTSKYPFRVIPLLPPKSLAFSRLHQDKFLNNRAAGLARFLNLLVQHSILSQDEVVHAFLFELSHCPLEPEFDEMSGKSVSPLFISQWKPEKCSEWRSIETGIREFLSNITALCLACERQLKRHESTEGDIELVSRVLNTMSINLHGVYPNSQDDLGVIQQRLDDAAKLTKVAQQNIESAKSRLLNGVLEQLKLYRDMLISILELFRRIKQLGGNNIPDLKRKIDSLQRKLAAESTKPGVKEEELHKMRQGIQKAQISIRELTNRDWQIKMIVSQELLMVQATKYQISVILRSFASALSDDLSDITDLVSKFTDSAETAPLNPCVYNHG